MRRFGPLAGAFVLAGCAASPAIPIVGSYFPAWLVCVVIGVILTAVIRQLLVMAKLERHLLLPPLTYVGLVLAISLVFWLFWFGI